MLVQHRRRWAVIKPAPAWSLGVFWDICLYFHSRKGVGVEKIRKFKNLAKIVIKIALLKKNENSRILNFVESPKIRNSRKFEQAKFTKPTVFVYWLKMKILNFFSKKGLIHLCCPLFTICKHTQIIKKTFFCFHMV